MSLIGNVFFLFFSNFRGFKTLAIFSFFEASFSNLHKIKEYSIFFPKKSVGTLRKFTPKINDWPKPLFSGLGYHSDNEPSMPFLIRFLRKNPNLVLFYLEHSSRLE